jgi:hypothetical protein
MNRLPAIGADCRAEAAGSCGIRKIAWRHRPAMADKTAADSSAVVKLRSIVTLIGTSSPEPRQDRLHESSAKLIPMILNEKS